MNRFDKLQEATILALQGKLNENKTSDILTEKENPRHHFLICYSWNTLQTEISF